jgi:hypothetical protein
MRTLAVLLAYLLITMFMTYPLVSEFTTHSAGSSGDDMVYIWNLWWVKHSIADLLRNPYYTDYIFHPYEVSLVFHSYVFLSGLLTIPFHYFMEPFQVHNLLTVLNFVLSGFGMFLLINHLLRDWRAAFAGGVVFAFSPYKIGCLTGVLAAIHWMPFYMLFMLRAFEDEERWGRQAAAAGMFLGFSFLTNYFSFIVLVIISVIYVLFFSVKKAKKALQNVLRVSVIGIASLPFSLPVLVFAVLDTLEGRTRDIPAVSGLEQYVVDVFALFSPSEKNPILGGLSFIGHYTDKGEGLAFMGFTALLLGLVGFIMNVKTNRRRMVVFWGLSFLLFTLLSFGPSLNVLGREYDVPLPFRFLGYIPFFENLRAPARLHIMSMFCLSVLSAYGLQAVSKWGRHAVLLLVPLLLIEYMNGPVTMTKVDIHPVYERIAQDGKAGTILEIPFFVRDGFGYLGTAAPVVMLYQTKHQKRIFSGYVSRASERSFFSFLELPVFRTIISIEDRYPVTAARALSDKRLGGSILNLFEIDYVIIHKGFDVGAVHDYLRYLFVMEKVIEDERIVVYRTTRTDTGELTVDMGMESSIPHLFRGWINGQREGETAYAWATGGKSVVMLNLREGRDYSAVLRARPVSGLNERDVGVYLNGKRIGEFLLKDGWKEYALTLSGKRVREGVDRLSFRFGESILTEKDFGGVISPAVLPREYLEIFGLYDYVSESILDWEQDNEKFKNAPVSAAFDYLKVTESE